MNKSHRISIVLALLATLQLTACSSELRCGEVLDMECSIRDENCRSELHAFLSCLSEHEGTPPPTVTFHPLSEAPTPAEALAEVYVPAREALHLLNLQSKNLSWEDPQGLSFFNPENLEIHYYTDTPSDYHDGGRNLAFLAKFFVHYRQRAGGMSISSTSSPDRHVAREAGSIAEAMLYSHLITSRKSNVSYAEYRHYTAAEVLSATRSSPNAMANSASYLAHRWIYPELRRHWRDEGPPGVRRFMANAPQQTDGLFGDHVAATDSAVEPPTQPEDYELKSEIALGRWNTSLFIHRIKPTNTMSEPESLPDLVSQWQQDRLFSFSSKTTDTHAFVWVLDWADTGASQASAVDAYVRLAATRDNHPWGVVRRRGRLIVYGTDDDSTLNLWREAAEQMLQ